MVKIKKRARDPIAQWARQPKRDVTLRASFAGAPASVNLKKAGAVDELRELLTRSRAPAATMERALDEAASEDDGETATLWTVSTRAVDSYNTTFDPDGAELEQFERNPIVLWAHDRGKPSIGKDIGAYVDEGKAVRGLTRFTPPSMNAFGHQVGLMVRAGFLNAVSIGFDPIDWVVNEERDDGESFFYPVDFTRWKLDEYSVVPIPSNPEALADGRAKDRIREHGIDLRPFVEWCEELLDGDGTALFVPRGVLERARKGAVIQLAGGLTLRGKRDEPVDDPSAPRADDDRLDDEEEDDGERADETLTCPECGFEGEAQEFAGDSEPDVEEEEIEEERAEGGEEDEEEEDEEDAEEVPARGARADQLSTRALAAALRGRGYTVDRAGSVDDGEDPREARLRRLATRAASAARRAAEQVMIEREGRLPGPRD